MTHVILFHHAQGLTDGVEEFAQRLRDAGHEVVVPDLYEGRVFDTLDAGVANAEAIGFETLIERGEQAADALPENTVYAGFSLGTLPAQKLAQSRAGALGARALPRRAACGDVRVGVAGGSTAADAHHRG